MLYWERAKRDRRRGDDSDHLLHQRHHLERRLPAHRANDEKRLSSTVLCGCSNKSGEELRGAQVGWSWGRFNLVEKDRPSWRQIPVEKLGDLKGGELKGMKEWSLKHRNPVRFRRQDGEGRPANRPKQIVKEGLSEYFLYTLEGTRRSNGWSKRMRSLDAAAVPFKINTSAGIPMLADVYEQPKRARHFAGGTAVVARSATARCGSFLYLTRHGQITSCDTVLDLEWHGRGRRASASASTKPFWIRLGPSIV